MVSRQFARRWSRLIIGMVVTLLTVSLPVAGRAATSGEFNGTWVANGSRVEFPFSADREIYTFNLSGNVSLKTTIGNNVLIMAYCHIGHDCAIGDNVIIANTCNMGGRVF